jgi:hypothetical protein
VTAGESIESGPDVPPVAGADPEALLAQLRTCADLRSDSDAIFLLMTTMWRRSVLTSRRTVLLDGIELTDGATVMDVAPGGGAIARWLLESGHRVIAWCRTKLEADLVAARCDGLTGLDVRVGDLASLRGEQVDLLVHLPVSIEPSPAVSTAEFLALAADVLAPAGSLVWSFANEVGLDTMCAVTDENGGRHRLDLAIPSIEASPWTHRSSRRAAEQALAAAGLAGQRWGACFPTAASPSAVLFDDLYARPEAARVVDQLVGGSIGAPVGSLLLVDPRQAHRRLVAAGLGPQVSPAHVVVATRSGLTEANAEAAGSGDGTGDGDGDGARGGDGHGARLLAALTGAERLRPWQQRLHLMDEDGELVVRRRRVWPSAGVAEQAWVINQVTERAGFVEGANLEVLVADAAERGDLRTVRRELQRWADWLRSHALPTSSDEAATPFRPAGSVDVLPPHLFDVVLSNFVLDADDTLQFIDAEWHIDGGVDLRTVAARALCRFAFQLVVSGRTLPWPATATADEIAQTLGHSVGLAFGREEIDAWHAAEGELSAMIYGVEAAAARAALDAEGGASRLALAVTQRLPFAALVDEVERATAELGAVRTNYEVTLAAHDAMASQRDTAVERLAAAEAQLADLRYAIEAHERLAESQRSELAAYHDRGAVPAPVADRRRPRPVAPPSYHRMRARIVGPAGGTRHRVLVAARRTLINR